MDSPYIGVTEVESDVSSIVEVVVFTLSHLKCQRLMDDAGST